MNDAQSDMNTAVGAAAIAKERAESNRMKAERLAEKAFGLEEEMERAEADAG